MESISSVHLHTLSRVKAQYESYPYPAYPLLATPRWQEATHASSVFCQKLFGAGSIDADKPLLVAGCGDMQPYIFCKLEQAQKPKIFVDLSNAAIWRAKIRCFGKRNAYFVASSLEDYLSAAKEETFSHIDAYGVLHHLYSPSQILAQMYRVMGQGATARIMVYNSESRKFIRLIKRIFSVFALKTNAKDLEIARKILTRLEKMLPNLAHDLKNMQPILKNDSRFVDTFFHSREVYFSLDKWLSLIEASGFKVLGLFDRYGELDHLPNPLWQFPDPAKVLFSDFKNNFEIYLRKPANYPVCGKVSVPGNYFVKSYPKHWFSYEETKDIKLVGRYTLWYYFAATMNGRRVSYSSFVAKTEALKRLARIGAILPCALSDSLQEILSSPMCEESKVHSFAVRQRLELSTLEPFIAVLKNRNLKNLEKRIELLHAIIKKF